LRTLRVDSRGKDDQREGKEPGRHPGPHVDAGAPVRGMRGPYGSRAPPVNATEAARTSVKAVARV